MMPDRWPGRLRKVAGLIPPGASVIDLGAGSQALRDHLPPSCKYTPADLPDFDMNAGRWPEGQWDVAVMAGVLEYANDPSDALRRLRALAPTAIVTYAHTGHDDLYRNRIAILSFGPMASRAGWRASLAGSWRTREIKRQWFWELRAR